ncbi:MAG: hypothetical protein AAF681_03125 [Pseudomonadota bacterium]
MQFIDLIGLLAGTFVVLTFYMTDLGRLRRCAIVSNVLFVIYALSLQLWPICLLHVLLLPLNLRRLSQLQDDKRWTDEQRRPKIWSVADQIALNARLPGHAGRLPWDR